MGQYFLDTQYYLVQVRICVKFLYELNIEIVHKFLLV